MKRTSETEIAERQKKQEIKSALFSGFILALIPFVNAFWYHTQGQRAQRVAQEPGKVAAIYWFMSLVLFLLPVIAASAAYVFIGTYREYLAMPAFWIGYLLPAFLVARKHLQISRALGTFYED